MVTRSLRQAPSVPIALTRRLLSSSVIVAMLLAASSAFAQELTRLDAPTTYVGALYRYQFSYSGTFLPSPEVTRIEFTIPSWMSVEALADGADNPIFTASELDTCGTVCTTTLAPSYALTVDRSSPATMVSIEDPGGTTSYPAIRPTVRINDSCPAATPDTARAHYFRFGTETGSPNVDTDLFNNCIQTLASIVTPIAEAILHRQATASPVAINISGVDSSATSTQVNEAGLRCATSGGSLVDCADPSFTNFATVSSSTFPFVVNLVAPNVVPTDALTHQGRVRIAVGQLPGGGLEPWGVTEEIGVSVVPQPVSTLDIGARRGGSPITPSCPTCPLEVFTGETIDFAVLDARNGAGGFEVRSATWQLRSPTDPNAPADVASWLDGAAGQFAIPHAAAPFPNDAPSFSITVEAIHPIAGSTSAVLQLQVGEGQPSPSVRCRIVAQSGTQSAAPGQRVTLVHEIERQDVPFRPIRTSGSEWTIVKGSGSLQAADALAVVSSSSARDELAIQATHPDCPNDAQFTMSVAKIINLDLASRSSTVAPGDVFDVIGRVDVADPSRVPNRLRFRMIIDPAFRQLAQLPAGSPAIPTKLSRLNDVNPVPNSHRAVVFEVPIPPNGSTQTFRFPLMGKIAAAGGKSRVLLQAFFPEGTDFNPDFPLAQDAVEIKIAAEPDLTESVIFGRVFEDANANGSFDEGEHGIPEVEIGLAAGIHIRTDAHGMYHIQRLQPGRHAVKVNQASLLVGSTILGGPRRELTLTPGIFRKVNFAVRPPTLVKNVAELAPIQKGLHLVDGQLRYGLVIKTKTRARVFGEGTTSISASTTDQRTHHLVLPAESTDWMIRVHHSNGQIGIYTTSLKARPEAPAASTTVFTTPLREVARTKLPPGGETWHSRSARIIVQTPHGTGIGIFHGSNVGTCRKTKSAPLPGSWAVHTCTIKPSEVAQAVRFAVEAPPDAHGDVVGPFEAKIEARLSPEEHFAVARGDILVRKFGTDTSDMNWTSSGAFLYRGFLAGGAQITAGADLGSESIFRRNDGTMRTHQGMLRRLFASDSNRIFRDLDPERYYPTLGDTSEAVDEREAGGRLFIRIKDGDDQVRWGSFRTALDDAQVGRFERPLYGLSGTMNLGDADTVSLRLRGFAAQPESAAALDTLVVTGSSFYQLRHDRVVEGSLQVRVEVLDSISGLPIQQVALTEGVDYEVDYSSGRLVLFDPIPVSVQTVSISGAPTTAPRRRLIANYEYQVAGDLDRDWSVGGALQAAHGPFQVTVRGVSELSGSVEDSSRLSQRYGLLGTGVRFDLGDPLKLRLDLARSSGIANVSRMSADGGRKFTSLAEPAASQEGYAGAAQLTSKLDMSTTTLYARWQDEGFHDSRNSQGRYIRQGGGRLDLQWSRDTASWAQLDYREEKLSPAYKVESHLLVGGASYRLDRLSTSIEGRYHEAPNVRAQLSSAALELSFLTSDTLTLRTRRRQVFTRSNARYLEATPASHTSIGADAKITHALKLSGDIGLTDQIKPFAQVGGEFKLDKENTVTLGVARRRERSFFGNEDVSELLVGSHRTIHDGTTLFTQQRMAKEGPQRKSSVITGLHTTINTRTELTLHYERGRLDPRDTLGTETTLRDAGSLGIRFADGPWRLQANVDTRHDHSPDERRLSSGAQGRAGWQATQALSLAMSFRGASDYVLTNNTWNPDVRMWEGTAGAAWRPKHTDWLNIFSRYVLTDERQLSQLGVDGWLARRSHTVALAFVLDVTGPISISPKAYYRTTRIKLAQTNVYDSALLAALRADAQVSTDWDVGVEGRGCGPLHGAQRVRYGVLTEATKRVLQWLRFGIGYNFSEISAGGVHCHKASAKGFYLRAEALY